MKLLCEGIKRHIGHTNLYHMSSNGVFHGIGCTVEVYLYDTYQEQPSFQQKKAVKIYEIVTL